MKPYKFATMLMLISFVFLIPAFSQQKDRIIKRTVWKAEPIKIVKVKVKNKIINVKEKFVEDDNWLKDFSIEVENVSNHTIVYLDIRLSFPQDENGMPESPAVEDLRYGVFPRLPGIRTKVKSSEPPLQPGDRAILKLDSYESLQALLNHVGHSKSIGEITVRIGRVVFTDETMWSSGQILKRDLNDPNIWVVHKDKVSLVGQMKLNSMASFNRKSLISWKLLAATNLLNVQMLTEVV